jgi:hypothetical protein
MVSGVAGPAVVSGAGTWALRAAGMFQSTGPSSSSRSNSRGCRHRLWLPCPGARPVLRRCHAPNHPRAFTMTARSSALKTPKIQPYDRSAVNTAKRPQSGRLRCQFGHARCFLTESASLRCQRGHSTETKVTTPPMPNRIASVRPEHGNSLNICDRSRDNSSLFLRGQFRRNYGQKKVGNTGSRIGRLARS